jgi:hypothetical protein
MDLANWNMKMRQHASLEMETKYKLEDEDEIAGLTTK